LKSFLVSFSLSSFESALGRVTFRYLRFFAYQISNINCRVLLIIINKKNPIIIKIPQVAKSVNNQLSVILNQPQFAIFVVFSDFQVNVFKLFELLVHKTEANVWLKFINNHVIININFFIYIF